MKSKGFTLLETVVALGLLALALTLSVTLVVSGTNLSMNSRDTTQANNFIQKGLSDAQSAIRNNCPACIKLDTGYYTVFPTTFNETGDNTYKHQNDTINNTTYNLQVEIDGSAWPNVDDTPDSTSVQSVTSSDFFKVTVTVTWNNRNGTQTDSAVQYIRRTTK
jgi:type II secretory pathway pseudopilin PulG